MSTLMKDSKEVDDVETKIEIEYYIVKLERRVTRWKMLLESYPEGTRVLYDNGEPFCIESPDGEREYF